MLSLTVRDAGRGFDPESVPRDGGLGLTSMRERLKLVAGELVIESQPGRGTTIVARVPLRERGRLLTGIDERGARDVQVLLEGERDDFEGRHSTPCLT